MNYPFSEIEPKWQRYWDEHQTFSVTEDASKQKLYVLDMFPYPSGSGLHVGHPEGYTATDIYCRFKRMRGFNVLHPMGWDAFGLPAEQYAVKTGIHPSITTRENVDTFRRQIKMLGLSYDWQREVDTTDPNYYKWTQWIFLKLFNSWYDAAEKKARPISELPVPEGLSEKERHEYMAKFRLAYQAEMPVNWCAGLGAVLANEEVDEWVEKGFKVERRMMKQWMLRITAYADRLEEDLAGLQWHPGILEMQRNWIGKSEGATINFGFRISDFGLLNTDPSVHSGQVRGLEVFTTRPDTIFGATYMVLAPEHPLVDELTTTYGLVEKECLNAVREYREATKLKSEMERTALEKKKTGVFTGAYAINPATEKPIPIWIADYVLVSYGTGAIMAVPGQDERDWEFAEVYNLPIVRTVQPPSDFSGKAFTEDGPAINSGFLDGLFIDDAKKKIIAWLEEKGIGKRAVKYKLRDWLFSRQRYWGEPVPIITTEDGIVRALPESELPLLLPPSDSFKPSETGESPLATITDWVNTVDPVTGMKARRETHTMPQWAGSCWYYLRYIDPKNEKEFISKAKEKYWMPIDLYVGGAEHAVLHLLYARFWHKVLFDLGYVSTKEPFSRLINQGTILGEDGQKMSKSRGNVINPDDVVKEYGADSLRLFEMFMGPLEDTKPWSMHGVEGVFRFLNRSWRMMVNEDGTLNSTIGNVPLSTEHERLLHKTIKKVTEDVDTLNFNTAISQMMIFVNEFYGLNPKSKSAMEMFVKLLSPFAPHIAEELWQKLGHKKSIAYEPWPQYDEAKTKDDSVEIVVQFNGKLKAKFQAPIGLDDEALKTMALADEAVKRNLDGKQIVKAIVVKNRLVNLVVK
ncbi:MAG: leucine--tRNA ligase [Ignavibacteriae bacterium]|nr:leucine--tRNA ligase [Ignavibacteriota bacterium]